MKREPTNGHDAIGVIEAVTRDIDIALAERNSGALADPAPTDADLVLRRMSELMQQVSDGAIGDLRRLRDDVDICIRQIQDKHAALDLDFAHHVQCVVEAMRFREIASQHLTNVRARFAIAMHGARGGPSG